MIEVRIEGLPDLRAALSSVVPKLQKRALRNALAAGARVVRDEARSGAPVLDVASASRRRRPGTLKKAINVRTSKRDRKAGDVGVFVNVRPAKGAARGANTGLDPFYWRWMEFGWTPARGPRTAAARQARRRASRAGASPQVAGREFLQRGARRLQDALRVFYEKIGPAIARLDKGGTP